MVRNLHQLETDKFSNLGYAQVTDALFGIPEEFTKQSSNERPINITKGQVNHGRLRPEVINEHVESSREAQSIVTSTNKVGQFVKISQDNINALYCTAESAAGVTIDDFESYNNDSELQATWFPSGSLNFIETTIVNTGTQSMAIPLDNNDDEWVNMFASLDYTNYSGSFDYYQDTVFGLIGAVVEIFIEDSIGNSKFSQLAINEANNWTHFDINENAMTEDVGNTLNTDITDIIKIGFRVDSKKLNSKAYINNLASTPAPGSLGLQIWNMGTTLPESGITSIDDGTQYTQIGDITSVSPVAEFQIELEGGKRLYHLHDFVCGVALEIPTNEILIEDNYYALVFTYIDTNVTMYGPDPSFGIQYYNNGYAFTAPDNATAITAIGEFNDLMFSIFSTQDVYVIESSARANEEPNGGSSFMSSIEDKNMKTTDVIHSHGLNPPQDGVIDMRSRPVFLPKGGKFNLDYNDDYTDLVTKIFFGMSYAYEPPETND